MTHTQKAQALLDEFEAATGIRPKYPRFQEMLRGLRETLDHYIVAQANVKAADARKHPAKDFAGEFARLSQTDVADDFDLDRLASVGELGGGAAQLLGSAKTQH